MSASDESGPRPTFGQYLFIFLCLVFVHLFRKPERMCSDPIMAAAKSSHHSNSSDASIRTFIRRWPIIDALFCVLVVSLVYIAWQIEGAAIPESDSNIRLIGANMVSASLTGALTAASVMLSGTLIGLRAAEPPSERTLDHMRLAVGSAVVSLGSGVYALALAPARVASLNLAAELVIAIGGAIQLSSMLVAGTRIFLAVLSVKAKGKS